MMKGFESYFKNYRNQKISKASSQYSNEKKIIVIDPSISFKTLNKMLLTSKEFKKTRMPPEGEEPKEEFRPKFPHSKNRY
jgi:hypothetical protein